MSVNILKPTLESLAEGLQYGFGVFREHANYWLVKYTDRKEILLSNNLKENPELVIFLYLNKERIIRDLYEELNK